MIGSRFGPTGEPSDALAPSNFVHSCTAVLTHCCGIYKLFGNTQSHSSDFGETWQNRAFEAEAVGGSFLDEVDNPDKKVSPSREL